MQRRTKVNSSPAFCLPMVSIYLVSSCFLMLMICCLSTVFNTALVLQTAHTENLLPPAPKLTKTTDLPVVAHCPNHTPSHTPRVCKANSPAANNFTLITALFDIGRDKWNNTYKRPFGRYIFNFEQVLQIDAKLFVIGQDAVLAAARSMRSHCVNKTYMQHMRMQELPLYKHRARIQEIMNSEEFRKDNVLAKQGNPEATIPEYDIVTLSKPYLIDYAIRRNPFNTSFFIWLDGGYGHGLDIFPKDGVWNPTGLYERYDKVTMIEREDGIEIYRNEKNLHKLNINKNAGAFAAGGKEVLQKMAAVQQEVVADWLKRGIVDDDQSAYMATYYRNSSLFRFVRGDWYDVFPLFNDHN